MFSVLVGSAIRFMMSGEQGQQMPLGTVDLGMGAATMRRLERLGDIEGKVANDVSPYSPLFGC